MNLLAIDPGPQQSAFVGFDGHRVIYRGITPNEHLLAMLRCDIEWDGEVPQAWSHLAIEGIACFGMPVGAETFNTAIWIGRFIEAIRPTESTLIYRKDVKMHLCHSMRAKDGNVRQAIIDLYGGKEKAIGKKHTPGPLYGVSSHCWSALAIAITYFDSCRQRAAS